MGALRRRLAAAAALALLAAGCGSATHPTSAASGAAGSSPATGAHSTSGSGAGSTSNSSAGSTSTSTVPRTTTTTLPVPQPGWTPVTETSKAILTDTRTVHLPDGASVTLVRFHAGTYRLDFHLGSSDPPGASTAATALDGDAVSVAERPHLIAAFNGGFKTDTGSGGVEADGHVFVPLVTGDASLVVDANGAARVGVWGQGLPAPGEHVVSVRQNLTPLISNGALSPQIGNVAAWGAELYGVTNTARSAIGTDPSGNLVYAASMGALPVDLATALSDAGVTNAMELDINPYWIQGDVAAHPGGPLQAAIPGQQRPADTYLAGWTRDFFAVLAR